MRLHLRGILLLVIMGSASLTLGQIKVTLDGKPVHFKGTQPKMHHGRVMVPLRGVFEAMGAIVHYEDKNRFIKVEKDNESIELYVGRKTANINGAEIQMDVAPILTGQRALVPLRFLAESLRGKVAWNGATNTVAITTGEDDDEGTTGGGGGR
jgi:hypothetical protein